VLLELPSHPKSVAGEWIPLSRRPENETVLPPPIAEAAPCAEVEVTEDLGAKRVLLLEDDPSFREIMKEFLTETGYAVREAQSGVEGIKEVLAGDFAVILCDMQMPALPGDLFYRAVERTRPQLCERFIFMTGRRGDVPTNDFIKAANGHVLLKPFHLDKLLEAIGEMERQRQMGRKTSCPHGTPTAPPPNLQSPASLTAAAPPPSAKAQAAVSAEAKRVLLLEDDPSFREVIKEFLTEIGYTVCEAQSGIEGIQEVLAGDFAVILCDMQMPTLAGDLFYRAVERARPQLCDRFIFMTGHRGDTAANDFIDFIEAAGGHALLKPFHLDGLLKAINGLATRRPVVLKPAAAPAPTPSPLAVSGRDLRAAVGSTTSDDNAKETFEASPVDETSWRPSLPVENKIERSPLLRTHAHRGQTGHPRFPRDILIALGSFAVLAVGFATWYHYLSAEDALLSTEVGRLDREWAAVSSELADAHLMQLHIAAFLKKAGQIAEESQSGKWTLALRSIAVSAGADTELRVIHVWKNPDDPLGRLLRIEGVSTGVEPRIVADRFSRELQVELSRYFQIKEGCRFERLDDEPDPPSAKPSERRAAFTLVAPISAALPAEAPGKSKN